MGPVPNTSISIFKLLPPLWHCPVVQKYMQKYILLWYNRNMMLSDYRIPSPWAPHISSYCKYLHIIIKLLSIFSFIHRPKIGVFFHFIPASLQIISVTLMCGHASLLELNYDTKPNRYHLAANIFRMKTDALKKRYWTTFCSDGCTHTDTQNKSRRSSMHCCKNPYCPLQ